MGRYIDTGKIKITADTMISDGECYVPLMAVKQAIARTPTEDVQEVRHGMWILPKKKGCVTYDEVAYKECSECGEVTFLAVTRYSQMNYCPNCGAKMDGEE